MKRDHAAAVSGRLTVCAGACFVLACGHAAPNPPPSDQGGTPVEPAPPEVECASNVDPASAIVYGSIVPEPASVVVLPRPARLVVELLGGFAILGDGTAYRRACSRTTVTELPAAFLVPAAPTMNDSDYAVVARIYVGDDETIAVGDYISSIFESADPAGLRGVTLAACFVSDCHSNVGGWCTNRHR